MGLKSSEVVVFEDSYCGITAANIYHYYKNKDELLQSVSSNLISANKNSSCATAAEPRIQMKDITKMMETLRWSQLNEIPKQFDFLETSMNNMIKLRFSETKSKDQEKQLAGEIKYSKCIIKQILSE